MHFPKSNRLLSKKDYQVVLDQPYRISQKSLLVLYKPNQKAHARLGLMIGKRVAALAVSRNRIKRAIRESFRIHHQQLPGFDFIVIARQHCDTLSKLELREGMNKLWERLIAQSFSS